MNVSQSAIVPPMSAKAFSVSTGQIVRVIDIDGRQPGDFVTFKADDFAVSMSQARSRVENQRVAVTQGHSLWTNTFPPEIIFTIVRDTHGAHDLLYTPCCRYALETRFGVSRDGCLEQLVQALEPWGVKPHEVPDPLNLFFDVAVDGAGGMEIRRPASVPGSSIELKAAMDCVVAISTCSVSSADRENSAYQIEILDR
jgi:uncharacterized protein YcgI (DUF1989 family)